MSIQLAKGETIVRTYDYASVHTQKGFSGSDTYKKLIVTNKRVVYEGACAQRGKERQLRQEMPISEAKYVDTYYGKTSSPIFILLGILAVVAGLILCVMAAADGGEVVAMMPGFAVIILGVIFFVLFLKSRRTMLACTISTDHKIIPALTVAEASTGGNNKKKRNNNSTTIIVDVNAEVAKQLVDELGSVLLIAAQTPVEEEAPAAEEEAGAADAPAEDAAPAEEL